VRTSLAPSRRIGTAEKGKALQDSFRRTGIEIGDRVLDVGFRDAEELSTRWRLGFSRVEAFLLRVRRTM